MFRFISGAYSLQGRRSSNEDRHVILESLPSDEAVAFFGIYDGHAGDKASDFCQKHLHDFISTNNNSYPGDKNEALTTGFLSADKEFLQQAHSKDLLDGTTVIVALLEKETGRLIVANAGDSRCILCRDGKALPMSIDHKPESITEAERIDDAGCFIWNGRINGYIAVSRAIGDRTFKLNDALGLDKQAVSSLPELKEIHLIAEKDKFFVLGCDGLWDVMSNSDVIGFVHDYISKFKDDLDVNQLCKKLGERAIEKGSLDNVTIVIVIFLCALEERPAS